MASHGVILQGDAGADVGEEIMGPGVGGEEITRSSALPMVL